MHLTATRALAWLAGLTSLALSSRAENWPTWRGPRLDGTSLETNAPVHWSESSNVVWKTPLPGSGHASPIVWEDRVFTVTALPGTQERALLCLDRATGRIRWQQAVLKALPEGKHSLNSHASSTPATDGERVFVAFLERREMFVAAHDFNGRQRWAVRPGPFSSVHGFCSSPILYQDKVIVNGDHDGDGFIVALDRATGRRLWLIDRPNKTRSYCAPLIADIAGRVQMVLSGSKCVASYDPNDGRLQWIIDGPTEQFVASPVFSQRAGLVVMTGGYPDHHILAIKPDGSGNVTQTHIAWRTVRGAAYVPSPIIAGDYFLIVSDQGFAHCFEAATGKLMWQERTGEQHASLVSANGLVYFLNDNGTMTVVRPGPEFDRVAQNKLDDTFFASPAISQGKIFLRGYRSLYCIGRTERK